MATKTSETSHTFTSNRTTTPDVGKPSVLESKIVKKLVRSITGTSLPNWEAKIRSKEINATTPLSATEETCESYSPGSFTAKDAVAKKTYTVTGISLQGTGVPSMVSDTAMIASLRSAAEAQALGKAYGKIQAQLNPFGASVMLGELKETIGLLRNPLSASKDVAKTLNAALTKLKYRSIKRSTEDAAAAAKAYAGLLLQFRFGIQPLIGQSIAILELAGTLADRNNVLTFRTYGTAEDSVTTSVPFTSYFGITAVRETTTTIKVECVINFGIKEVVSEGGSIQYVKDHLSDIMNIPLVLWELTYLSWMVDYMSNVDSIITASTTSTKGVIWQSKSIITTKTIKTLEHSFASSGDVKLLNSSNEVKTLKSKTVIRTTDALSIPTLQINLPGYRSQLENMAAFFVQKLF